MAELLASLTIIWGSWLFFAWIFSAFAAGWVAESKGYSGLMWFLWGALFGPLAVLTVGMAESSDHNVARRRRQEHWDAHVRRRQERAAARESKTSAPSARDEPKVYEIP